MAVFFQIGATTGGVDDDCIAVIWLEHLDVMAGKLSAALSFACMYVQRSAASLVGWGDHFAAIGSQDTNGGLVNVAIDLVHYAATDEANSIAPTS